ncbi:hypothetical protein IC235_03700 [Hymenobacter sp. BT664]|uniref:Fibronectin type-III domain-containing protein n=1 Tax=Hymenobacter montanus TaxID=2771359 RepID=A0A927BAQ2_9BACT|nr:hypothetical protein [Hymenobacter montanus]MBD2766996.1 hypothetical protein [Hymenobacter montanus]
MWATLMLGLFLVIWPAKAQTLANMAVRANAVVQKSPARITLTWTADANAIEYKVFRKLKADNTSAFAWLSTLTTDAATVVSYNDNTVSVGVAYEYKIQKTTANPNASGEGYVLAGIEVPATEYRGKLVLLVRDTHAAALAPELSRLEQDLVGDGWQVIRHDVGNNQTPPQVRALIQADYRAAPAQVRAVLLLGNVPVPYSGNFTADGHDDHIGAWAADGYYGDVDGNWTDVSVNNPSASRAANRNVPGDGKFDQSTLASDLELEVGRVDLSDLPAFAASEVELLRRYLNKDHQYRHKVFSVAERGLIDNNFGTAGGFANNGWRNFSALLGAAQTSDADYFSTLRTQDHLWAYGCGGGSYTGAGGVGSTDDFANGPVKCVFNMFFGSYFGDWDSQNNFLRACIAAEGYTLTDCSAGVGNYHFHHMALGETIGYGARLSQNNSGGYAANIARSMHMGLMGDPTLRLHPVRPVTNLAIAPSPALPTITWTASPEAGLGYYVYRAASMSAPFTRLTPEPLTATSFTDPVPLAGTSVYMVRAVRLQNSASGSYVNLSQGVFGSFTNPGSPLSAGLNRFTAQREGADALLSWTTSGEKNPRGFRVEVSTEGRYYRPLGFVAAEAGDPRSGTYSFRDAEPAKTGTRYYQLRQENTDGTSQYYAPQAVFFSPATEPLSAYPTRFGASQPLTVELTLGVPATVRLHLRDAVGRTCWQASYSAHAGLNRWVVSPTTGPAGTYLLVVDPGVGMSVVHQRVVRE